VLTTQAVSLDVRGRALDSTFTVQQQREALYQLGSQAHPDMTEQEMYTMYLQGKSLQLGITQAEVMEEALYTWDQALLEKRKKDQQRREQNLQNGVIFGY
jgi:hypothetical protein